MKPTVWFEITLLPALGGIALLLLLAVPVFRRYSMYLIWRMLSARTDRGLRTIKSSLLKEVTGVVVEIGPGLGATLPYYAHNEQVKHVYMVEHNEFMMPKLRKAVEAAGLGGGKKPCDLILGTAEKIPLPDASADAVVCTLVLCSVPSQENVLREVLRVLRPGGKFYFVEHVVADAENDSAIARRLQHAFTRTFWPVIGDGCELTRRTGAVIENTAGWGEINMTRLNLKAVPPFLAPHVFGVATKA